MGQHITLSHSVWWTSLAIADSHLSPFHNRLPFASHIYTPTTPPPHQHFFRMKKMGGMPGLCRDGTLLHAPLPHKFVLIDSHRSHMLGHCGAVCGRVCVHPPCCEMFRHWPEILSNQKFKWWIDNNMDHSVTYLGFQFKIQSFRKFCFPVKGRVSHSTSF